MTSETLSQAVSEQGVLYEEIGSFNALYAERKPTTQNPPGTHSTHAKYVIDIL